MKICDLHTHSIFSDGTFTPTEIINHAEALGISAVALCDHNTIDGLPEFIAASKGKNVEAIPGVEFSVDLNGKELHLLGLCLKEDSFQKITEIMQVINKSKEESNILLIDSLNKAGYKISFSSIKAKTPNGKFNRAHIAVELVEKGYCTSIKQAFSTLLAPSIGHYIEPKRFTVYEMIDFIKSIGAVSVLAHPFLNLTEEELLSFLPIAKRRGLVGIECYYSLYDEATTEKSFSLAKKFGLKFSGGSDFHGANKPDIELGIGKGNLKIPYEFLQDINSKNDL